MVRSLPTMLDTQVQKIPWGREWQPTPVFLLGESHGQRSLEGYSSWGQKELDTTARLTSIPMYVVVVVKVSVVYDSLWPHGLLTCQAPRPLNSPGSNTGVGWHFLLRGIFLTQGLNLSLLHCRQILYHLNHEESPDIYLYIFWKVTNLKDNT